MSQGEQGSSGKAKACRDLDPTLVNALLRSTNYISDQAAQDLFDHGLNGEGFEVVDAATLMAASNQITLEQATKVCKLRDRLVEKESTEVPLPQEDDVSSRLDTGQKSNPNCTPGSSFAVTHLQVSTNEGERTEGHWQGQVPRKFGKEDITVKYTRGHVLPVETGLCSPMEPAREHKALFDTPAGNDTALAAALVKRAGRFIVGCLNSALNGTMHFGVADAHSHGSKYKHGEVVGLALSPSQMDMLQGALNENFVKAPFKAVWSSPWEQKVAIENCVRSLIFVRVVDESGADIQPPTFVVELDIEPRAEICENMVFYLDPPALKKGKKTKSKRRKQSKSDGEETLEDNQKKVAYFRDGSSTNPYTDSDGLDGEQIQNKVKAAWIRRRGDELKSKLGDGGLNERLDCLLSLDSSGFPNDRCKYILVCDNLGDLSQFEWIHKLRWYVMFDLSDRSDGNTDLCRQYQEQNIREVKKVSGEELTEGIDALSVDALELGEKVLHVTCGPAGNYSHYANGIFPGLSMLIHSAFNGRRIESPDKVMVIAIVSAGNAQKEMLDILLAFKAVRVSHFVSLFSDSAKAKDTLSTEMEMRHSEWSTNVIHCSDWKHLQEHMNGKLEQKAWPGHTRKLPCSTEDVYVTISDKELTFYEQDGLSVLTSNHCEESGSNESADSRKFHAEGRDKILDFLRGREPDWTVFYFHDGSKIPAPPKDIVMPTGLVKRDMTERIIREVQRVKVLERRPIARIAITHEPGSGATTIGMSVLWSLRKENRCVKVDGRKYVNKQGTLKTVKVDRLAELILGLRAHKEIDEVVRGHHPNPCRTVVILFDNCTPLLANVLTTRLLRRCEENKYRFVKTMFVMLCNCSTFNTLLRFDVDCRLVLAQKLSRDEQQLFASRLIDLEQKTDVRDMLSFVIMAKNFNASYVKKVVSATIRDLAKMYSPRQQKLLLYLAILKYFAEYRLPRKYCEDLVRFQGGGRLVGEREAPGDATFSPHVMVFVNESRSDNENHCFFLEVNHSPVALELYRQLLIGKSLSETVNNMMREKALVQNAYMPSYSHSMFVYLLTKRTVEDGEKTKYSKLIDKIIVSESREQAIGVLKTAHNVLLKEGAVKHKSIIAQSLARVFYRYDDDEKMWEKLTNARMWAEKAVEYAPENFMVMDTVGQVYKKMLQYHLKQKKKNRKESGELSYGMEGSEEILEVGQTACNKFEEVTELYRKTERRWNDYLSHISRAQLQDKGREEVVVGEDLEPTRNLAPLSLAETNLLVMEHLLGCDEMQSSVRKDVFIKALVGDSSVPGVATQFENLGFAWTSEVDYVAGLYRSTVHALSEMARSMTYTFSDEINSDVDLTAERLVNNIEKCDRIFGFHNTMWKSKLDSSNIADEEKIRILRMFLTIGVTNTFGFISRQRTMAAKLRQYADHLNRLITLSNKNNLPLETVDKITYINLVFGFDYHGFQSHRHYFDPAIVRQFCIQLVKDEVAMAEPYFFFTILFWPGLYESELSDETFHLLSDCMKKLKARQSQTVGTSLQPQQPKPLFYVAEGDDAGQQQLKSALVHHRFAGIRDAKKFKGELDEKKNVVFKFGDRQLTLRNTNLFYRMKPDVGMVTFKVVFTSGGPVADFVTITDAERELERMRTRHQIEESQ